MKTALTQLIDDIENREYNYLDGKLLSFANSIQEKAKQLLEAEKEQIKEAYEAGHLDGYELGKYNEDEIYPDSSYYQQTFKSDE